MSTFWTSSLCVGNDILLREIRDGKRVKRRVRYEPFVFLPGHEAEATHRTIRGAPVFQKRVDSISAARDLIKELGEQVHGYDKWEYVFLTEEYPGKVEYDPSQVRVAYLDIETMADSGMPDIDTADKEITAITFKVGEKILVFGCGEYEPSDPRVIYFHCKDEFDLLNRFLSVWSSDEISPDIITGWNIEFFDIPYLVNRIRRVIGQASAERLSPWNRLREKTIFTRGEDRRVFIPMGISVLDYQKLYHKLAVMTRAVDTPDDYKLNTIAHLEVDEKKIDYSDFEGLHDLYLNDFQRYIDYNIHDVILVEKINDKRQLIELVMAMAYNAKVNFEDMLGSVKPWECILHNKLLEKGVVLPPRQKPKPQDLIGAYVKDPTPQGFDWVVSFDLNSLYPMLINEFNISPETRLSERSREYLLAEVRKEIARRELSSSLR